MPAKSRRCWTASRGPGQAGFPGEPADGGPGPPGARRFAIGGMKRPTSRCLPTFGGVTAERPAQAEFGRSAYAGKDMPMSHTVVSVTSGVEIQPGAVVSKVIYRDDDLNVTVFGFDAGEGLTEHQASRAAIVQVVSGQLRFIVDGEELDLLPSSWLHLPPGTPHALAAVEPTVMLLTLLRP